MQSLGHSGGRVQWKKATIVQYMFQDEVAVSVKGNNVGVYVLKSNLLTCHKFQFIDMS